MSLRNSSRLCFLLVIIVGTFLMVVLMLPLSFMSVTPPNTRLGNQGMAQLSVADTVIHSKSARLQYQRPGNAPITVGNAPYHASLRISDALIIDQPGFHMGRPQVGATGRLLAVALIPTGSETAQLGQILLIDVTEARIIGWQVGYAARWVQSGQRNYPGEEPIELLEIDQLLDDGMIHRSQYRVELAPELWQRSQVNTQAFLIGVAVNSLLLPSTNDSMPRHQRSAGGMPAYPDTIRVLHHAQNNCRSVAVGEISVIPFEEYVARVLPAEVPASWSDAALEAQAIAVRTYAWYQIQLGRAEYDVSDFANFQMMCDARYPATDAAVVATQGRYLSLIGDTNYRPIIAMYSAENGHPTLTNQTAMHLQSVPDLFSLGRERNGHGYGLSQWGAQRRGLAGFSAAQIIDHYYTDIYLRNGFAPTQTLISLSQPVNNSMINSASIRWQTLTSGPMAMDDVPLPRISITTSQTITRQQIITFETILTRTETITVAEGVTETIVLTESIISTETELVRGPLIFTSDAGIWPLPPQLTDGDIITIELRTDSTVLEQSILTIDRSPPLPPELESPQIITDLQILLPISTPLTSAIGSNLGWSWRGEALFHTPESGTLITDNLAIEGKAWQGEAGKDQVGVWYGPYTTTVLAGQAYRALFWLRADAPFVEDVNAAWNDEVIARLDVTDDEGRKVLGLRDIRFSDLNIGEQYAPIGVEFYLFEPPRGLEFRVAWRGNQSLALDEVQLWTLPQTINEGQLALDIGRGHGPRSLSVAAFDEAGNVSQPFIATLTTIDQMAPQVQSFEKPTRLFTNSPLRLMVEAWDPFSGIDAANSQLRLAQTTNVVSETGSLRVPSTIITAMAKPSFPENPWADQTLLFEIPEVPVDEHGGESAGKYDVQLIVADQAGNENRSIPWSLIVADAPLYRIWLPVMGGDSRNLR